MTAESIELGNADMGLDAFVALVDINCDDKDVCGYSEIVAPLNDDSV